MKLICKRTIFVLFTFLYSLTLNAQEMRGFLTPDDIALFYEQGYLLKRQCLSPSDMYQLQEDITIAIDKALYEIGELTDPVFSDEEQIIFVEGSRIVFKRRADQSVAIARINGCGGLQPALLKTLRSEQMLHTFFELLGTDDLEHLISQIHPKLPGDGIAFQRHQDIQYRKSFDPNWEDILGNGSYAICIIPIDRMTPANGGLWIDRNNYPEQQGLPEDRVWLVAEPGDLIFMHPYLFHGSGPNLSNFSRKTLLTGFCAFGANHKPYPGAHVNVRFILSNEGEISMSPAPWMEGPFHGPGVGH